MSRIKNREALLATGEQALRAIALEIAEAGLAAADPGMALRRELSLEGDIMCVGPKTFDLREGQRIFVIGAGKATFPIAKAIEQVLGDRIHAGLVTCKYGQTGELQHIQLNLAKHPVPDAASIAAAEQTVTLLTEVKSNDIVLACFTGGSSSLFVSPVAGVTLDDKAVTSHALLTCGANIVEINAVRKHLSRVKGGRLVRNLPAGVHLINLTVSDVIGDFLDYITDPTVPDTSSFDDARATLDKYNLWAKLPESVQKHLKSPAAGSETVKADELSHLHRTDILLLRTDAACVGAAQAARKLGFNPLLLSTLFEGESSALGRAFAAIAKQVLIDGNPVSPPCVLIGGGETIVTLTGQGGSGGPNQEFAVSAALELAGCRGIVALGIDTDGTDGPTTFAGGIVDGFTRDVAREAGVDLLSALRRHDVSSALEFAGCVISTEATGTNVNDLKLVVVAPDERTYEFIRTTRSASLRQEPQRVAVLMGGVSKEREVSLVGGAACASLAKQRL